MMAVARAQRRKVDIGHRARIWARVYGSGCVMVVVVVVGDTETGQTFILGGGSGEINRVVVL